jgi:prepilin-type N-terminal cleavage/methylation domain-containing protein
MMKNRGFTLIELLVVIAIIGLFSSIALASMAKARTSANNAKFSGEMKSLFNALGIYKLKNGSIPFQDQGSDNIGGTPANDGDTSLDTALNVLVTDKDIPKIPHYNGWVSGGAVPAYIFYRTNSSGGSGTAYNLNCGVMPASFSYSQNQTSYGVLEILTSIPNLGLRLPKQDVWKVFPDGTTASVDANSASIDVYCIPLSM